MAREKRPVHFIITGNEVQETFHGAARNGNPTAGKPLATTTYFTCDRCGTEFDQPAITAETADLCTGCRRESV